jgi:hypothetical protein
MVREAGRGFGRRLLATAIAGFAAVGMRAAIAAEVEVAPGAPSDDVKQAGTAGGSAPAVSGPGNPPPGQGDAAPAAPVEPLRFPQNEPAPVSTGLQETPSDILSAVRWNLGPTRLTWSGLISLDYFIQNVSPGLRSNNFDGSVSVTGSASTFVWQPWFIQLNGLLGLNYFYSTTNSNQPVQGLVNFSNDQKSTLAPNANADVQVFPYSRFPFEAYLNVANSNTQGKLFDQVYDTWRAGLRQRYTSPRGDQTYGFAYDHSVLDSRFSGLPASRDTLDVVTMTGSSSQIRNQSLSGYLEWDRDRQNNGFSSDNYNALLQDFWAISPQADLSSDASYRRFKSTSPNLGLPVLPIVGFVPPPSPEDRTFAQLNSYGNWRSETLPLTAFGTLRYAYSDQATTGASTTDNTLDGSIAATYNVNRNAILSGRLGATAVNGAVSTNESVLGNYNADAIPLGGWQYFWNASGSLANITGGSDAGSAVAAGFGQNGYRSLGDWVGGPASLSLYQSLAQVVGSGSFLSHTTLGLGGALNWNRQFGGATANAGLSVSDTRTWGEQENEFDLANLQVGLEGQFTRYSGWSGNLTAQWTRQEQNKPQVVPLSTDSYVNANISYRHFRVFNVPRLQFTSTLQTFAFESKREEGNLNAAPRNVQWRWDNRLFYSIGKSELEARAQLNRIEVGPTQTNEWLVGIRILRRLGN